MPMNLPRGMRRTVRVMDRKWWTLIAVSIATFMLLLDITIVNVALPEIERALGSSFSDLQWVIDAYALTLAALLLTGGSLADLYGRRRIFVIGIVIFTVASALCALAGTPLVLNLARALQGIGGAFMFATSLALLASAFQGRDRGTAFGVWGAVTGASVAVGPLVGGVLTDGIGWEAIFLVNIPIGIGAIAMTLAKVEESHAPSGGRLDWPGLLTFSGGLFALIFALIRGNAEGWGSPLIVGCLVAAVGARDRLRARRAPQRRADARPLAVLQARLRGRLDRRLRAVGVDVLDVPLPHALHPEHPRLHAARVGPALPARDAALVPDRADLGQVRRAPRDPLVPRRRACSASASGCS